MYYTMQVNLCPRLINSMIKRGVQFIQKEKGHASFFLDIRSNPNFPPKNDDSSRIPIPTGLYATAPYAKGEIVRKLRGELLLHPTKYTIHIGNGMHVLDEYGKYMNHSFDPNTVIHLNNVIAIKDMTNPTPTNDAN